MKRFTLSFNSHDQPEDRKNNKLLVTSQCNHPSTNINLKNTPDYNFNKHKQSAKQRPTLQRIQIYNSQLQNQRKKVLKTKSQRICSLEQHGNTRFKSCPDDPYEKLQDFKLVFKKTPKSANNKNSESKSFTKATKVTQINSKKNSLLDKINAQTQTENFKVVKAKKMKLSAKTAKKLPKQTPNKQSKHSKTVSMLVGNEKQKLHKKQTKSFFLFEQNKLIRNLLDNSQQPTQSQRRYLSIDSISDERLKVIQQLNMRFNSNDQTKKEKMQKYFNSIDMRVVKNMKKDFPNLSKIQKKLDIAQLEDDLMLYYTKVKRIPIQHLNNAAQKIQRFWRKAYKKQVQSIYGHIFKNILSNQSKANTSESQVISNKTVTIKNNQGSKNIKLSINPYLLSSQQQSLINIYSSNDRSPTSNSPTNIEFGNVHGLQVGSDDSACCSNSDGLDEDGSQDRDSDNVEQSGLNSDDSHHKVIRLVQISCSNGTSQLISQVKQQQQQQSYEQSYEESYQFQSQCHKQSHQNNQSLTYAENQFNFPSSRTQHEPNSHTHQQHSNLNKQLKDYAQHGKQQDINEFMTHPQPQNTHSGRQKLKEQERFKQEYLDIINKNIIKLNSLDKNKNNLIIDISKNKAHNSNKNQGDSLNVDRPISYLPQIQMNIYTHQPKQELKHMDPAIDQQQHQIIKKIQLNKSIVKRRKQKQRYMIEGEQSDRYRSPPLQNQHQFEEQQQYQHGQQGDQQQSSEMILVTSKDNQSPKIRAKMMSLSDNKYGQLESKINQLQVYYEKQQEMVLSYVVEYLLNQVSQELLVILTQTNPEYAQTIDHSTHPMQCSRGMQENGQRNVKAVIEQDGERTKQTNNQMHVSQVSDSIVAILGQYDTQFSSYSHSEQEQQQPQSGGSNISRMRKYMQQMCNISQQQPQSSDREDDQCRKTKQEPHQNAHSQHESCQQQFQEEQDNAQKRNWLNLSRQPHYQHQLSYQFTHTHNYSNYSSQQSQSHSSSQPTPVRLKSQQNYRPYTQQANGPVLQLPIYNLQQPTKQPYPQLPKQVSLTKQAPSPQAQLQQETNLQQSKRSSDDKQWRHQRNEIKIDQRVINFYLQILIQTILNNRLHQRIVYSNMQEFLGFNSLEILTFAHQQLFSSFSISVSRNRHYHNHQDHSFPPQNQKQQPTIYQSFMQLVRSNKNNKELTNNSTSIYQEMDILASKSKSVPSKIHKQVMQYLILIGQYKKTGIDLTEQWYKCAFDCFNEIMLQYRPMGTANAANVWQQNIRIPHYFQPASLDQVLQLVRSKIQCVLSYQIATQFDKPGLASNLKQLDQEQQKQYIQHKMTNFLTEWIEQDSANWGNFSFGFQFERLQLFIYFQKAVFAQILSQTAQEIAGILRQQSN